MTETIENAIERDAIDGVSAVTVDGTRVEQMTIDERIKAANFVSARRAASRAHGGMKLIGLVPPGAGP